MPFGWNAYWFGKEPEEPRRDERLWHGPGKRKNKRKGRRRA